MLGYPIFKIVGMSSVVRVISTPQNVNPETHFLSLLVPSLPQTHQKRPLTCPEPFDEAQGERNSDILDPLTTELPAPKLRESPFRLIGNYKLPQAFTLSGLITIIGR
jgi:hypothetical protein